MVKCSVIIPALRVLSSGEMNKILCLVSLEVPFVATARDPQCPEEWVVSE